MQRYRPPAAPGPFAGHRRELTAHNAYGDLSTEGLTAYNMQPWHTFRVNTTMKFNLDCSIDVPLTHPYPDPIII